MLKTKATLILSILILSAVFVFSVFKQKNPTYTQAPKQETKTEDKPQNPKPYDTKPKEITQTKACASKDLGFTMEIPRNWTCKPISEENTPDASLWATITSDKYTIHISTLGRGPYCGDGPSTEPEPKSCEYTDFFNNETLSVSMWTYDSLDREIFGYFKAKSPNGLYAFVSITYENIEYSPLSETEKTQLIEVLSSIKRI